MYWFGHYFNITFISIIIKNNLILNHLTSINNNKKH